MKMDKLELLDQLEQKKHLFPEDEMVLKRVFMDLILDRACEKDCSEKCFYTLIGIGAVFLNEHDFIYSSLRSELVLESTLKDIGLKA